MLLRAIALIMALQALGCSATQQDGTDRMPRAEAYRPIGQFRPPSGVMLPPPAAPGPTSPHKTRGARQYAGHDDGPRLELALTQAAYAVPLGGAIGSAGSAQGVLIGAAAAGTLAGVIGWAVGEDMTSGQVQTVNSAMPWLVGHGAALTLVDQDVGIVVAGAGYLLAPLVGGLLATQRPEAGTVALANSAGMWTVVTIALARNALNPSDTSHFIARDRFDSPGMVALIVAGDLAIVGGALLGHELQPTRSQVFALDGAALLGMVTGALVGVGLRGASDHASSQMGMVGLLVGVGAGLAMLYDHDVALPDLPVAHLPLPSVAMRPEGGLTLGFSGTF
jgi:hypothetical protein